MIFQDRLTSLTPDSRGSALHGSATSCMLRHLVRGHHSGSSTENALFLSGDIDSFLTLGDAPDRRRGVVAYSAHSQFAPEACRVHATVDTVHSHTCNMLHQVIATYDHHPSVSLPS